MTPPPGHRADARAAFTAAVRAPLNLTEAALHIGAEDDPHADLPAARARLHALATDLAQRLGAQADPRAQALALGQCVHAHAGLGGNTDDYYAVGNSHVHRVLEHGRGIPVSLAVVYLHLAAGAGIRAHGIGFPGHFLVGVGTGTNRVLLDPWDGRVLDDAGIQALARRCQVPTRRVPASLSPLDGAAIVGRMLGNLRGIHRNRGDALAALACCDRALLAQPDDIEAHLARAECYVDLDAPQLARAELEALCRTLPAGALRDRLTQRAAALAPPRQSPH